MGKRDYAHNILKILRKEAGEDVNLPDSQLISRDDGHDHTEGLQYKTLRQLTPTEMRFQIILDDLIEVWKECPENVVRVFPYVYFTQ